MPPDLFRNNFFKCKFFIIKNLFFRVNVRRKTNLNVTFVTRTILHYFSETIFLIVLNVTLYGTENDFLLRIYAKLDKMFSFFRENRTNCRLQGRCLKGGWVNFFLSFFKCYFFH